MKLKCIISLIAAGLVSAMMCAQADSYLLQLNDRLDNHAAHEIEFANIKLIRKIFDNPIIYLVEANNKLAAIDFKRINQIASVERLLANRQAELRTTEPNDPLYSEMWHLMQIKADQAWDFATSGLTTTGDSIVLAIFDSGYEIAHADISANIWRNDADIPGDGIDNDNNGYIDDSRGLNIFSGKDDHARRLHGTEVFGTMAARGDNAVGISGVTWNCQTMLISKSQGGIFESDFIEAYNYAIQQRKLYNETAGNQGAFVVAVNLSIGISRAQASDYPLWCAVYDELGRHGILGISATDNDDYNVDLEGDMPTTCPSEFQISVTGSDRFDNKMNFVAYGPMHIDLVAPGEDILTTTLNNDYTLTSGTSLATPMVTGAVGLVYMAASADLMSIVKANPSQGALLVREFILSTVDKNELLESLVATGGRLNLEAAVSAARNYSSGPPPTNLSISKLFPTPTQEELTVDLNIPTDEPVQFSIIDLPLGRELLNFSENIRLAEGTHSYTFSTALLSPGAYLLTIEQGDEKTSAKFVKIE